MSRPHDRTFVVTARNAAGEKVPAAYMARWFQGKKHLSDVPVLPHQTRQFVREHSEPGYAVKLEPLEEMPEELVLVWMLQYLLEETPAAEHEALLSLVQRLRHKADRLRRGELANRHGEQLFVAVEPSGDEVLDLVFTRYPNRTFTRRTGEWIRSSGIDGNDYLCYTLVGVTEPVLTLFDETERNGTVLSVDDLKRRNLVVRTNGVTRLS